MSLGHEEAVWGIVTDVREAIDGHYAAVVAEALGRAIGPVMLDTDMLAAVLSTIRDNAVASMCGDRFPTTH